MKCYLQAPHSGWALSANTSPQRLHRSVSCVGFESQSPPLLYSRRATCQNPFWARLSMQHALYFSVSSSVVVRWQAVGGARVCVQRSGVGGGAGPPGGGGAAPRRDALHRRVPLGARQPRAPSAPHALPGLPPLLRRRPARHL